MIVSTLLIALASQDPSPTLAATPVVAAVEPAATQGPRPGQWVRISTADPVRIVEGKLKALNEDSLVVQMSDGGSQTEATLSRAAIAHLDLRVQDSKKAGFALVGVLLGGVIGFSAGGSGGGGSSSNYCSAVQLNCLGSLGQSNNYSSGTAFLGALVGGALGALVAPGAKWQKDILLDRLRVSAEPIRRGARFSMTLTF
jgi:hypothetical protein